MAPATGNSSTHGSLVASPTFGLPEPRLGRLPLDGGMLLLSRQNPRKQAMGMLLTGRRVAAGVHCETADGYLYYNAEHKHWVEPLSIKISPLAEAQ